MTYINGECLCVCVCADDLLLHPVEMLVFFNVNLRRKEIKENLLKAKSKRKAMKKEEGREVQLSIRRNRSTMLTNTLFPTTISYMLCLLYSSPLQWMMNKI